MAAMNDKQSDILISGNLELCAQVELAVVNYLDEHRLPEGVVKNPRSYELVAGNFGSLVRFPGVGLIRWSVEIVPE